jgi:hypothetical protein
MPDIFAYDDFDKCMALSADRVSPAFCVVNSILKPNNSSDLYKFIEKFSTKEKQHFRHDKLNRGICVRDCIDLVEKIGNDSEFFYTDGFHTDSKLTLDFIAYPFKVTDRSKLNRILNICVNYNLKTYNLRAFSEVEYCLRHDATTVPTGLNLNTSIVSSS